jgi:Flp pilus assembly protein TadG
MTQTRDLRRFAGDEGSVFAEFALALPLLVWMALGIFEFGMGWRDVNGVRSSLRTASRTIAQAKSSNGNPSGQADRLGLQALNAGLSKLKNADVDKVIVYWVNTTSNATGALPNACKTASTTGSPPYGTNTTSVKCNVYIADQLSSTNLVAGNFGCGSNKYDNFWCPSSDRTTKLTASGGPTFVGVWASLTYDTVTGLLPVQHITISDRAISRLEPDPTAG